MSNTRLPADSIVVVGRQFGSGGRKIGRRLAEEFGLAYYDKEMLAEAARRLGFSEHVFARYDERPPSALRSWLSASFGVQDSFHQTPMSSEAIYAAQSRVINELADYILRHRPHLASIFLHAPAEHRAQVLLERGEVESHEKGIELARKIDRNREDFYNYFTGRRWGHADNYHLTLDTSLLSDDAAYDVVRSWLLARLG